MFKYNHIKSSVPFYQQVIFASDECVTFLCLSMPILTFLPPLFPLPTVQRPVIVTPLSQLVRDPYVLVTAGAVMVSTSTLAVLEPCLPIWLTDNLHLQVSTFLPLLMLKHELCMCIPSLLK